MNSKKICILTLHFYENFGSVLQAYALRNAVSMLTGYSTDILPFKPANKEYQYFQDNHLKYGYLEKKEKFDIFRNEFCGMPNSTLSETELRDLSYDYYIVGSDQVWNPEITKLNPAYFLDFVCEGIKISYAASMALDPTSASINDAVFKKYIPNLDYISLREKAHIEYIQQFTDKTVCSVVDPTMLLTVNDYNDIVLEDSIPKEPYILSYFLTHEATLADYTIALARRFGLKIVHYYADYPDRIFTEGSKCFAFDGPREFLGLIKNASLIFTNSFHGTVFSILFERPFYTYIGKRKMLSRVMELTSEFHLEDRRFSDFSDLRSSTLDIDYKKTKDTLMVKRKSSEQFILSALKAGIQNV